METTTDKNRKGNRMLLAEPPLVLLPSLATAVGAYGAIALQQLNYHLTNPNNGWEDDDGERWIYKTYEDWQKDDFPFWSIEQIQRIFWALDQKGLIISCQPEGRKNRRKYYRIEYDRLDEMLDTASRARVQQNAKSHLPSVQRGTHSESSSLRSEHTHCADGADDLFLKELKSDEQRQIVIRYNKVFVPLGWLPIEKITQGVRIRLKNHTVDQFKSRCAELLNDKSKWPHTLRFWQFWGNSSGKRKASIPYAKRQAMINKLNARKECIYRAHPNGLCQSQIDEIAKIDRSLAKL
jgi:hypothetical protein